MTRTIRHKLDPAVLAMHEQGRLLEFDCEWIANLPKAQQLAAAEKCTKNDLTPTSEGRIFKGKGTMRL